MTNAEMCNPFLELYWSQNEPPSKFLNISLNRALFHLIICCKRGILKTRGEHFFSSYVRKTSELGASNLKRKKNTEKDKIHRF